MKLTTSEKNAILSGLLKQQGITAASLNRQLDIEKGGWSMQAIEAKAKIDAFVKDFDRLCELAAKVKRESRSNKPLGNARRSLERLCATRPAIERFKHYAKTEGAFNYVKSMMAKPHRLTATEAIVVFTHSKKSSHNPVTVPEATRHSLVSDGHMARLAKKFCASIGFEV